MNQKQKQADRMIMQIRYILMKASTLKLLELNSIIARELIERKVRGYDR